ncbi:MAG: hypothetical protein CUN55_18085, partial [Phototrophicales bacterium]
MWWKKVSVIMATMFVITTCKSTKRDSQLKEFTRNDTATQVARRSLYCQQITPDELDELVVDRKRRFGINWKDRSDLKRNQERIAYYHQLVLGVAISKLMTNIALAKDVTPNSENYFNFGNGLGRAIFKHAPHCAQGIKACLEENCPLNSKYGHIAFGMADFTNTYR